MAHKTDTFIHRCQPRKSCKTSVITGQKAIDIGRPVLDRLPYLKQFTNDVVAVSYCSDDANDYMLGSDVRCGVIAVHEDTIVIAKF